VLIQSGPVCPPPKAFSKQASLPGIRSESCPKTNEAFSLCFAQFRLKTSKRAVHLGEERKVQRSVP
jgi:hypothetical protein